MNINTITENLIMDGTANRVTSLAFIETRNQLKLNSVTVSKERIMSSFKLWAIKYAQKQNLYPVIENVEDEDEHLLRRMIDLGVLQQVVEDSGEQIYLTVSKFLPHISTSECELLFWGLLRNHFSASTLDVEETKFKGSRSNLQAIEAGQTRLLRITEDKRDAKTAEAK